MMMQDTSDKLRVRKDQAKLSPGERKAFVNAVLTLKQIPSQLYPPSQNRYDDYVAIHSVGMLLAQCLLTKDQLFFHGTVNLFADLKVICNQLTSV
jgi:hypothetical protein